MTEASDLQRRRFLLGCINVNNSDNKSGLDARILLGAAHRGLSLGALLSVRQCEDTISQFKLRKPLWGCHPVAAFFASCRYVVAVPSVCASDRGLGTLILASD